MKAAALLAFVLAACSDPESRAVHLDAAVPDYGPLVGGTVIALSGTNFTAATRVSIGGREAPLVRVVDEDTLEVVIPPGEHPGHAEITVFDTAGSSSARGIFRYSAPPTITAVAPAEIVFTSSDTVVTVTGTGFLDEGAGRVNVLLDGVPVGDVHVVSDTQLTFTAPEGRPLVRPAVEVLDARGTATMPRAFHYRPSARGGLLLFPAFKDAFADFYDPVDHSIITIPIVTSLPSRLTAVVRGDGGDYWGLDRSRRFGRIDPRTTSLESPRQLANLLPTITRAGSKYYAIDRIARRIGVFDPGTGEFAAIGTETIPCCGSFGLASDGTTLYFTSRSNLPTGQVTITPVNMVTGALGVPVPVQAQPSFHVEEMRFFQGTLYAASRDGTFVTLDPATGATTALPIPAWRYKAMEVFE